MIPSDLDTLLTRKATAAALTAAGYPVTEKTLATKATRGGGPPFQKFGRVPLYRWCNSLGWARSKLGPLMGSTSEADASMTTAEIAAGLGPCSSRYGGTP